MTTRTVVVIFCACVILTAYAQDCKVRGISCADHEQCCGGCCYDGVCYDTYRTCQSSLDVCKDHVCIGEENCFVYIPPQCPGCEPLALCRVGPWIL